MFINVAKMLSCRLRLQACASCGLREYGISAATAEMEGEGEEAGGGVQAHIDDQSIGAEQFIEKPLSSLRADYWRYSTPDLERLARYPIVELYDLEAGGDTLSARCERVSGYTQYSAGRDRRRVQRNVAGHTSLSSSPGACSTPG